MSESRLASRPATPMKLAEFVHAAEFANISPAAVEQLKIRVLNVLGAAIAALPASDMASMRERIAVPGDAVTASLIGGGRAAVGQAAFHNVALGAYLDFTDSYIGPIGSCRPSDCIGAVLAAADSVDAAGSDFLAALAVAYQIQTHLCDVGSATGPATSDGLACAVAAAAAKVMRLEPARIGGAIAGAAGNNGAAGAVAGLPAKVLAPASACERGVSAALHAASAAHRLQPAAADGIAARGAAIDWSQERLQAVLRTVVKRHMADIRLQAAIDAAVTIGTRPVFHADAVRSVRVTTFRPTPVDAVGRKADDAPYVHTKAQAERSLPYTVAVALIDRQVQAAQYAAERIVRPDVQWLSRLVRLAPPPAATRPSEDGAPTQVAVRLHDDTVFCVSVPSFQGYSLQQWSWDAAWTKFRRLTAGVLSEHRAMMLADCVHHLDAQTVRSLLALLPDTTRRVDTRRHGQHATLQAA